jgi:hypothetical protein
MCFIGHGAFGIITKPIWCNYFAVLGVGHDLAYQLMPIVGSIDILLGLSLLVYPVRAVFAWLVVWGVITASLRPLSGEPFAELIERAGNFGAPLAMLLLSGVARGAVKPGGAAQGVTFGARWFKRVDPNLAFDAATLTPPVKRALQIAGFLLLLGHGWLNLLDKKALIAQYTALGFAQPLEVARWVGLLEMLMAFSLLIRSIRHLLIVLFIWKVGSELFYPHYEIFEWVERGGSYGVLLALIFIAPARRFAGSMRYPTRTGTA